MKGRLVGIFIVAVFLITWSCSGSVSAQEKIKIATISIQDIIENSKAGKEAQMELEAELTTHQDKLTKEQEEIENMKSEIEKKSSVWSEEIRGEKEREYQKKVREFQLASEDAKYAMQQLVKKLMEPILKTLNDLIAEIGKKEGYTLILENTLKGLRSKSGLLYADDSLDISDKIRKELDSKHSK